MVKDFRHILLTWISLILNFTIIFGELVAKNSGIQHIECQDVGMVFYVEIKNEGKQWCAINTRMIKCCETICPSDVECEHMQLVGGDMGILASKASRNVTLVWPTLYLHDRIGECIIAIGYTTKDNQTGEIHQKVKFDTSVSSRNVRPVLQGYYGKSDARKCSTVDQDTLDDCRPVNCHIKYNGKRNFFNRRQQRCQAVPICIADTTKELPDVVMSSVDFGFGNVNTENYGEEDLDRETNRDEDLDNESYGAKGPGHCKLRKCDIFFNSVYNAYVPASNTCRDLENAVNEMEVRALSQGIAEAAWRSEPHPYLSNIYCHHGSIDNTTGFCVCHDGWTSKPVDNLEPSTEMIHLCNVQMLSWPCLRASGPKTVLTIIAALLAILMVLFCCAMAYVVRRQPSPEYASECGRQAMASSCALSSTKSRDTCSSGRPYKRFRNNGNSDISVCQTKRIVRQ